MGKALQSHSPGQDHSTDKAWLSNIHDTVAREVPQIHCVATAQKGRQVMIDGRWCTDFASCNYLGLDLHPQVQKSIEPAVLEWGTHPSWTRAVCSPQIYIDMEKALAKSIGAPLVLAFPTITLLHTGILPLLAGDSGVLLVDEPAHNCLYEASLLAQAKGAKMIVMDLKDTALAPSSGRFG